VPTYLHQNNPVVRSLLEAQARGEIQCAGIVLSRGNFESIEDKRRSGELAAHLALQLGADGVIVSIEGFGNATVHYLNGDSARVGAVHGYREGRNVARLEPFALLWRHGEAGVTCRDF
jgi:hypothetical protein